MRKGAKEKEAKTNSKEELGKGWEENLKNKEQLISNNVREKREDMPS